jgi:hypothetical protein
MENGFAVGVPDLALSGYPFDALVGSGPLFSEQTLELHDLPP